jgi:hypothetical protein
MSENPSYWSTIATVIPVIALTYATALRRYNWHRLSTPNRRWRALYGAVFVGLLAWSESRSLLHLQLRSSSAFDETFSLFVVMWAALQVLAVPIAPLVVIALHDLHPTVRRAKKEIREAERSAAVVRRDFERIVTTVRRTILEARIDGANRVLRDPSLVYDSTGWVRADYIERVHEWRTGRDLALGTEKDRNQLQEKLWNREKDLKRSRKKLDKTLRAITKRTVKMTNWR